MLSNSIALIAVAAMLGVEAFKAKDRTPRLVLTAVAVFFALSGVLIDKLAVAAPKLVSFVTSIFAEPSSWFVLFIALFFVLRPLWQKGGAYDDSALQGEMAESDAAIEALAAGVGQLERKFEANAKLAVTTQEKQGKWCDLTTQRIEAVEAAAQGARDYAEGTNHGVGESLGTLEKEQRLFIQRMETWVGSLRREIRLGFKGVDQGFAAIYAREQLLDMAFDLTKLSDWLTQPSRGEPLGDWADWQNKAADWHKAVEAWARLAEKYKEGTVERVFDAPSGEYKQDWGVEDYDIFPDHNAVHDYKLLCIISRNFHVERKSVDQYMLSAAFVAPSKKPKLTIADLKELEDENPPALSPPRPKVQS